MEPIPELDQIRTFASEHAGARILSTGAEVVYFSRNLFNVSGSTHDPPEVPGYENLSWRQLLIEMADLADANCYVTNAEAPEDSSHANFSVGGHMTTNSDGSVELGGDTYLMPLCHCAIKLARLVAEGAKALRKAKTDQERRDLIRSLFAEIYFQDDEIIAFTFAPTLLPANGGESLPGIAHGLVSLSEAFRVGEREEPVPEGMKRCSKCGEAKLLEEFNRMNRNDGDGVENRRARCKKCENTANAERHKRRQNNRKN